MQTGVREYTIKKNLKRLKSLREFLEENKNEKSITKLFRNIGGSSRLQDTIVEKKVVVKEGAFWRWNEKIPVTRKLSKTISEEAYKKGLKDNKNRPEYKEKKTSYKTSHTPAETAKKTSFRKSRNKNITTSEKEVIFLWGLFKYTKRRTT